MNERQKVELPVESCFKLFDQSFNRIKRFSKIGECLSVYNLPSDWGIKNDSGLTYSVEPLPEDKKAYVLDGFRHFLQCYLVRDCIESFMLCLDSLYLLLSLNGKQIKSNQTLLEALTKDEKENYEKFTFSGLSVKDGKIKKLEERFNLRLSKENKLIISSLKDVRDCLTHGNGIVQEKYGNSAKCGKRKFSWKTFHIFAEGISSKKKHKIELGKSFSEEVNLCLQIKECSKDFNIGEQLSFTSYETYEIAWSLQEIARGYLNIVSQQLK